MAHQPHAGTRPSARDETGGPPNPVFPAPRPAHRPSPGACDDPSGTRHCQHGRARDSAWSRSVRLRFHLRGLENVELVSGGHKLSSGVANSGKLATTSVRSAGASNRQQVREQLPPGHPLRLEIRRVELQPEGETGGASRGFFELAVPAAFLEKNPELVSVRWIDFYR